MAYLTDMEKRLLFSALAREKEVCKKIDSEEAGDGVYLVPVIESLERKFYYDKFEQDIYEKGLKAGRKEAVDKCIKILDTKEPKYQDALNDRYDMIEYVRELKAGYDK